MMIIVGLLIRVIVTPYSSGSDIPQFYGFANTFLRHGFSFYSYANGFNYNNEGWPYSWSYVYPPLPIFLFTIARLISGGSTNIVVENTDNVIYINTGLVIIETYPSYNVYVNPLWIITIKSIFILFDVMIAILLYMLAGGGRKGLIVSMLYYLNPMVIYISAVYGMFDQVAFAFILLSLFFMKRNIIISGIFMGFALATKQTIWMSFIPFLIYLLSSLNTNKIINFLISLLTTFVMILLPFIIFDPNSLYMIFKIFLNPEGEPGYTEPIVYSFNGISSLMTYYNNLESSGSIVPLSNSIRLTIIRSWILPFIVLFFLSLIYTYISKDSLKALSLGYMSFIATYWRINHQYLVPLIGLLALLTVKKENKLRMISIILIILSGFWPIMFPTSFWFHVHLQPQFRNELLINLVNLLTIKIFDQIYYVIYSLTLTITLYIFVIINTVPGIINTIKKNL
ncbi:MAG: hypothetical protein ACP5IZ_10915 [Thermoprotei archaeon]|jgi:hypothetical protein